MPQHLTRRELEVLRWLARGKDCKETARSMGIAPTSVQNYVKILRAKMGAANACQAVAEGFKRGYLGPAS
jgi:DNA-binding CsgD family transcriptional regulator